MIFLNRLRLVLALAGLVFTVAGLAADNRAVIWTAMGLLAGSFGLRLYLRKRSNQTPPA
jgi:hypothetical protein